MKNIVKCIVLLFISLSTSVIIYPFLHEMGHCLAATLFGARVVYFNMFPIPYIICDVSNTSITGQIIIGYSGILLPFLLSNFIKVKNFLGWYILLLLKGISLYSLIISFFAIVLNFFGVFMPKEDITQILKIFPQGRIGFIVLLSIMIFYGFTNLIKEKPFLNCSIYFDINNT